MSDLFGNHIVGFPTRRLIFLIYLGAVELDNLPLKKDALKSLGLPLEVKKGNPT